MTAIRRASAAAFAAAVLGAATACEHGLFAPGAPAGHLAHLSITTVSATQGGSASAFDRADAVRIRVARGTEPVLDSALAFRPAEETRVAVAVELASSSETLDVAVELRSAGAVVFRASASATLTRDETTAVAVPLVPVPSALQLQPLPALTAIGDSAWARGAVVFSTGDTIRGPQPTWTSLDPAIVSARTDGLLVARAEGQARIQAAHESLMATVPVTVSAVVTALTVSPRTATAPVGGAGVQFSAIVSDRRGNVLTRPIGWTSSNTGIARVDAAGLATPVAGGSAYIVASVGSVRDSAQLVVADVPPAAPSGLSATTVSTSQIDLAWTDNASNEAGFRIERCTGESCTTFTEIATVAANATTFQNTGLTASTSYSYRVRAYNASGPSAYSNTATATTGMLPPGPPSSLRASAVSSSRIDLAWTDASSNEAGFRIERCTGANCTTFNEIATVGANVTTYQNTGLAGSTSYGYRVRAYNAGGSSSYSNTASATTPAPAATLTVTIDGNGAVTSSGVSPALNCAGGTCSQTYPAGTVVSLTANQTSPDFSFGRWLSTDGGFTCSTSPACVVTMDRDRTVRAWFPTPGLLSVTPSSAAFTMTQGGTPTPASRTITVSDVGDRPVTGVQIRTSYSPSVGAWLSATINRTVIDTLTPGTMTLAVIQDSLAPGTYNATVYVGDFVMTTAQVGVTLTVQSLAPTISGLSIALLQVNDSANCSNGGSSYRASFAYADADGDVTSALAVIRDSYSFSTGEKGTLTWPGAGYYTVGGNGFSGTISAILCTVFAGRTTTDSFTVQDGAGHLSNAISASRSAPPGANGLPSGTTTATSSGTPVSGGGGPRTNGSQPAGT